MGSAIWHSTLSLASPNHPTPIMSTFHIVGLRLNLAPLHKVQLSSAGRSGTPIIGRSGTPIIIPTYKYFLEYCPKYLHHSYSMNFVGVLFSSCFQILHSYSMNFVGVLFSNHMATIGWSVCCALEKHVTNSEEHSV